MSSVLPFVAALTLVGVALRPVEDLPPLTFPLDPVQLVAGDEVAGRDAFSVVRDAYRYVFVDEKSRQAFLADPEAYAIQLGGACARMGPLSGRGSTELHAVHDGHLYLFASEACRKTFLSDPSVRLERDDPAPETTPATRTRGRGLLAKLLAWTGGAAAVDEASSLVLEEARERDYAGETYEVGDAWMLELGRSARHESWWEPGSRHADVLTPKDAFTVGQEGSRPLDASQRRALQRLVERQPLELLRARHGKDYVAAHAGTDTLEDRSCERLLIATSGTTTTLLVDGDTGELLGQEFVGRGPDATMGLVRLRYLRTAESGGLRVPCAWSATFDGEPADGLAFDATRVEIDASLPATLFTR